jgi:NO-binding membrane sensor protein with MHYT domain
VEEVAVSVEYNYWLVVLSIGVAALASYTALDLTSRITASRGLAARAWLFGGAFAMGVGIWSMHFIGMLAFNSPIPFGYEIGTTLLSLFIAIVASGFALYLVSRPEVEWHTLSIGGIIMGAAIVSMHYVGMAAIVLDPPLTHDVPLIIASVGVAIAASMSALGIIQAQAKIAVAPRDEGSKRLGDGARNRGHALHGHGCSSHRAERDMSLGLGH